MKVSLSGLMESGTRDNTKWIESMVLESKLMLKAMSLKASGKMVFVLNQMIKLLKKVKVIYYQAQIKQNQKSF